MEKVFGLIGYPVSHSWSANYFSEKFSKENLKNHHYELFPIKDLSAFPELISSYPNLVGLNVTIPHKENIIPFLHDLDLSAADIGAVNTIKFIRSNSNLFLKGFNTDVIGFEKSLEYFKIDVPQKVLILGTGGAAKAVEWVLKKKNCQINLVTRNPGKPGQISYSDIKQKSLEDYTLIINTTPLGMYPDIENMPDLPYHTLTKNHVLYDLIYNPEETLFLQQGKERGCKTVNGLYMLQQQAEAAWSIWNSK